MNSFKINIDDETALSMIAHWFHKKVSAFEPIDMGELSKVYCFKVGQDTYVVHFRNNHESFIKTRFLYEQYGSILPIPRVIHVGHKQGVHFMISEQAKGQPVSSFSSQIQSVLLDDLALVYSEIARAQVIDREGFGWISPQGKTAFHSWKETLENMFQEETDGFYKGWPDLFQEGILERDVFDQGYSVLMKLAKYAPDHPYLVHGDFHLGNMIADGNKVTGIVDWEMAMQGDFMFDLAGLHFWSPQLRFPERIKKAWDEKGVEIPHFKERLYGNMIFKATDGLRFFAKKQEKPSYDYIKNRLAGLLQEINL